MNENVIIRFAEIIEYPNVKLHYKACNYGGGLEDENKVVIALSNDQVIGTVRLCDEHDNKVLRGMYIKPEWQKQGIGSAMLRFLLQHTDMRGCFCLPYKSVQPFYALLGFHEISVTDAPAFLAERLQRYFTVGNLDIIIMQMNGN